MSQKFAAGKIAVGFCDKCNQRFKLALLRTESIRGRPLRNRVCPSCWDEDHPQNFQGQQDMSDPQALQNPRPDPSLAQSREIPPAPYSVNDIPKFN